MGYGRWDDKQYRSYTASVSQKSQDQIFTQRSRINEDLDPLKIRVREARDSDFNPESTPIMLFSDVTGSMGVTAEILIREGLGKIMKELYDHQPVKDPQILCGATGDSHCDEAPLQVTQFEASVDPLVKQLEKVWIEKNGGGNGGETYSLAWWFAAARVVSDAWQKRGRKGYIFTIGDECCHDIIPARELQAFVDPAVREPLNSASMARMIQLQWNTYHLIVQPVVDQPVERSWRVLLGNHAVMVEDINKLPEVIAAIIRVNEGQQNVTQDRVVGRAVAQLTAGAA